MPTAKTLWLIAPSNATTTSMQDVMYKPGRHLAERHRATKLAHTAGIHLQGLGMSTTRQTKAIFWVVDGGLEIMSTTFGVLRVDQTDE